MTDEDMKRYLEQKALGMQQWTGPEPTVGMTRGMSMYLEAQRRVWNLGGGPATMTEVMANNPFIPVERYEVFQSAAEAEAFLKERIENPIPLSHVERFLTAAARTLGVPINDRGYLTGEIPPEARQYMDLYVVARRLAAEQ